MLHDKVFGVGFMAAAASMFGYSYMQKEKAFEELNQTFVRMKNEWEESKERLIGSLFSQEEKIRNMEEERKTRDLKILKTEEKLKEMEQEREDWKEHRLQLIREKEALSQKVLSAEKDEDVNRQTLIKMNEREEDRLQLIREKEALSQTFLSAENVEDVNQTLIKNERGEDKLQLIQDEDAPSLKILSAEKNEDGNCQTLIKKDEREEDRLIREKKALSQTFVYAENNEDVNQTLIKMNEGISEKEALSQRILSAVKDEDLNQILIKMNEMEEDRFQLIREKEASSQTFLFAENDKDVNQTLMKNEREEDRLQLILEKEKEALSQAFLSAESDEDMSQTPIKRISLISRISLIREKETLSQTFLSAENVDDVNQTLIKNERGEDKLLLIRDEDALSQTILSEEKDEDVNRQPLIKMNERAEDRLQLIREKETLSQTFLQVNQIVIKMNEMEDRPQLIREKETPSQTFLSAENDEDVMNEMKTTEKLVLKMEEMEDGQENKTPVERDEWEEAAKDKLPENALSPGEKNKDVEDETKIRELLNMEQRIKYMEEEWREEKKGEEMLQLIEEKEPLSPSFLSAEQESEDVTNTAENEVPETEEMKDVQKWTNQFSDVCELMMDIKTANIYLSLSENNRKVTRKATQKVTRKVTPVRAIQSNHSDSFEYWQQVMCREGLTERCYCVVEWRGKVSIAVTYRGIKRTGWDDDGLFGNNDKSWSLECTLERYTVCHNKKKTVLAVRPSGSNRVGMYLDFNAGILSFYRVSDARTHLHTFLSTFTEPLYPGFWLGNDSYVSLLVKENDLQTSSQTLVAKSASPAESLDIEA